MRERGEHIPLYIDIALIIVAIAASIWLARAGALDKLLVYARGYEWLESFIAGLFFTSVFTTAPAIVALGKIATTGSIGVTAFFGALGALVGDSLIFHFIRDRLSDHLTELIRHEEGKKRIKALFKKRFFRWFTFFIGGLIIASPLPDEAGLAIFGFSKMRTPWFVLLSLSFNFIGILLIGLAAKAL